MFYIKGSKHLYLIGYNFRCNLPIWSNRKNQALHSTEFKDAVEAQEFLKKQNNNVESKIAWE